MNIWRVLKIAMTLLVLGLSVGFVVWTMQVMPADESALAKVQHNAHIEIQETARSVIARSSDYHSKTGVVFFPGAKVDPHAYIYKLSGLVESTGVTIVIAKPYFNLALLDLRPIATFTNDVNDIDTWYVAGHSLGGVRACQFAADNSTHVAGLILFGSYCNVDVQVPTLSLSAEQDKLTTAQDIESNRAHLQGDLAVYEIPEASHASFGDYGVQAGDGEASIDSEFMRLELTDQMSSWLGRQ